MRRTGKKPKTSSTSPQKAPKIYKKPAKKYQNPKRIVENLQELHRWQGFLLNNLAAQLAADPPALHPSIDFLNLDQNKLKP
jgi:hypothetical protein